MIHRRGWVLTVWMLSLLFAAPAGVSAGVQQSFSSRCGAGVDADEGSGFIWLPAGEIFCPLVADPKEERSFVSYLRGDFATIADAEPGTETNIGAVGIGDTFALLRSAGNQLGDGIQLNLSGAVFTQFNLDEPSFDLINADYLVGLPLTFRRAGFSGRLRIYHQSSHLGDEFLLSTRPERINLSFESVELLLSQELGSLRVYGGGEAFFSRSPTDLVSRLAHAGFELRPTILGRGRLLAAVDMKVVEEEDWDLALSARAGVEIARLPSPGSPPRVISLVAEFYDGVAPYGQFYREDIRYIGVGLNLSR